MRYTCATLLLLLITGGSLFAQQAAGSDLQSRYNSLKMSIAPSAPNDPTTRQWVVTEGFDKITEPTFLKLAGYPKEARKSQLKRFGVWSLLVSSGVLSVAGMLVMAGPLLTNNYAGNTVDSVTVGGGLAIGGLTLMAVGVFIPMNILPYGRAEQIARDYNQALLEKLNGGK